MAAVDLGAPARPPDRHTRSRRSDGINCGRPLAEHMLVVHMQRATGVNFARARLLRLLLELLFLGEIS